MESFSVINNLVVAPGQDPATGDFFRLPYLRAMAVGFLVLAVIFAGKRGLGAIVGMGISILVIMYFVVPRLLAGDNPFWVCIAAATGISISSLYLAHGFKFQTTLALTSTLVTLFLTTVLASLAVSMLRLTGLGSEEAAFLLVGQTAQINLQGLLLGGMVIGTLGVLDDITIGQTAVVAELKKANPRMSVTELFKSGLNVGREHIASLVNTLFLAYAGAALPLFLLFSVNNQTPLWVTINSEFVAEEIVRALVGSTALIISVPIATYIAARMMTKKDKV